jgi:colanic acid/amylovoran biosynthesis protein
LFDGHYLMASRVPIAFFGASPRTNNMGVNALFASTIAGLRNRISHVDFTVFDSALGDRRESFHVDSAEPISLRFLGYRTGRRVHRSENLFQMNLASRLGALGSSLNSGVAAIRESVVTLDVSGGDSFTDMYPDDRIHMIAGCKELVLRLNRPLILLPQTYGPFDESLDRASRIVRASTACFARDERSFENLKKMLGSHFDPDRHRCGVDMAFGLEPRTAEAELSPGLLSWLADDQTPVIGLNISGLIGNSPTVGREKYGFKGDYRQIISDFVRWVLSETESRVVLVPHVMTASGQSESDAWACEWLKSQFAGEDAERILISPTSIDQSQVKWLISKFDWFSGTRMHATIAGLSSLVPTSTVAYSDKAIGVFESCGQGREVFDPRVLGTDEVVEGMKDSFRRRHDLKMSLGEHLPRVKEQAARQMDDLADIIQNLAHASVN